MLKQLEKLIKKHGIAKITFDLGYRSTTTIRNWLTAGQVPELARVKVKTYLKKGSK